MIAKWFHSAPSGRMNSYQYEKPRVARVKRLPWAVTSHAFSVKLSAKATLLHQRFNLRVAAAEVAIAFSRVDRVAD